MRRSAASAARARPGESVAQPRVTRPHLERRRGHKEPPAARHGLRHLELATQEWALNACHRVLPQRVCTRLELQREVRVHI